MVRGSSSVVPYLIFSYLECQHSVNHKQTCRTTYRSTYNLWIISQFHNWSDSPDTPTHRWFVGTSVGEHLCRISTVISINYIKTISCKHKTLFPIQNGSRHTQFLSEIHQKYCKLTLYQLSQTNKQCEMMQYYIQTVH